MRSAGRGLEEVDALGDETAPCRCAFIGPSSKAVRLAILRRQAGDEGRKGRVEAPVRPTAGEAPITPEGSSGGKGTIIAVDARRPSNVI